MGTWPCDLGRSPEWLPGRPSHPAGQSVRVASLFLMGTASRVPISLLMKVSARDASRGTGEGQPAAVRGQAEG